MNDSVATTPFERIGGEPAVHRLVKRFYELMDTLPEAYGIRKLKSEGMVMGGDAARLGIGTITDARMKQTYDLLVRHKLLDPAKVDVRKTYTTEFIKDLKVMP